MDIRAFNAKAKSLYSDDWIYGSVVQSPNGAWILALDEDKISEQGADITSYPIDEDTICYFTGLSDKNDKLIFEGSVVKNSVTGKIGVVVYILDIACFVVILDEESGSEGKGNCDYITHSGKLLEVLGDYYDNPCASVK